MNAHITNAKTYIFDFLAEKIRTHCIGIPNPDYMTISSNQLGFGEVKSLMPLDTQYWTTVPIIQSR